MEALSAHLSRCMCLSRRHVSLLLVGIVTSLVQWSSAEESSVGGGSVRTDLFPREHTSSPSVKPECQAESLLSDVPATAPPGACYEYLISALGTPPNNFVAVLDTGSDLKWMQCKPCTNCFNRANPVFDPTLSSSTYQYPSCSSSACSYILQRQDGASTLTGCSPSCEYIPGYGYVRHRAEAKITLKGVGGENMALPDFWFGCWPILYNEARADLIYYIGMESTSVGGVAISFNVSSLAIDSSEEDTFEEYGTTKYTELDSESIDAVQAAVVVELNENDYLRADQPPDQLYPELCHKNATNNRSLVTHFSAFNWQTDNKTVWFFAGANESLCVLEIPWKEGSSIRCEEDRMVNVLNEPPEDPYTFSARTASAIFLGVTSLFVIRKLKRLLIH